MEKPRKSKPIYKTLLPLNLLRAELCRQSFYEFVKYFFDVVIQEKPVFNWHIKFICDECQAIVERLEYIPPAYKDGEIVKPEKNRQDKLYDLIINISPGSTKSTIVTQMLPAWAWTRDATLRILSTSYSDTLSTEHSVKTRQILKSDKFRELYPRIEISKDKDTQSHYKNVFGGDRYATSTGGTITGFHGHLILIDDPSNPKQALSDAERESTNRYVTEDLSTRKVNKSQTVTILIMQRLHVDDATGKILKEWDNVRHICIPGEVTPETEKMVKPPELLKYYKDGLMDPIRLNRKDLAELRTKLGSYGFAGQIGQMPAPPGGGLWKKSYITPIDDEDFPTKFSRYGTDWDLAYTEKEQNSASAYCTAGQVGNNMYIDDIGFRWLEFPALVAWMKTKPSPHYIEAKASGKSAKQTLTNQGIPAIEVQVKGGQDKIARTQMATPYGEAGLIYIRRSLWDKLLNDERQGLTFFPNTGTDLNDAVVQSINRLLGRKGFFVV